MADDGDRSEVPFAPYPSYREVLESIREYAIFLLMPDNTVASWNIGVEEVFGYGRDEFIGQSGTLLFVPEDVAAGIPEMEKSSAESDGIAQDNRWHLRKDGSRFWANGVMLAFKDEDGEVVGFIKILRDNTAQKEAEDALQRARTELEQRVEERTAELHTVIDELERNERLFAAIFRAGPFAAAVLDAREPRFLEVNEAFTRLTGYTLQEVTGVRLAPGSRAADDGATMQTHELARALWGDAGETGFRDREMVLTTHGGDERVVMASGVPIPLNGRGGRLVMFFDITERKRSEDELMQAIQDVMQDANWFSRSVVERLAEIRGGKVDTSRMSELTRRERQVLEQVARGRSNAEIAGELGIAPQTVRNYITSVYEKIGVKSRVEAVVWARERGMGV